LRLSNAVFGMVVLASLGRIPIIAAHWPAVATASLWFTILGSIPLCAMYFWAFRCTLCGGGIKLNVCTCSRCGHVYP